MNEQRYAVFFSDGGYQHNEDDQGEFSGVGLNEIIALGAKRWPHCLAVAWAPEWPGGGRTSDQIRAESLAAGRLIEKTPSGWVALGAEKQEPKLTDKCVCGYGFGSHWLGRCPAGGEFKFAERAEKTIVKPELRKVEPTSADLAMIARDGPAKPLVTNWIGLCAAPVSTAKPNPFPAFRSPDCDSGPSDHLNASRHQMAGMKG